jgi:hypothetical protein
MYIPYADAAGMLIHINGTFTLGKLKPKNQLIHVGSWTENKEQLEDPKGYIRSSKFN